MSRPLVFSGLVLLLSAQPGATQEVKYRTVSGAVEYLQRIALGCAAIWRR
jgi:hypothetical protein